MATAPSKCAPKADHSVAGNVVALPAHSASIFQPNNHHHARLIAN
jgi:hypothetical protein